MFARIRWRLVGWNVLVVALILAVVGAIVYGILARDLVAEVDRALSRSGEVVATRMEEHGRDDARLHQERYAGGQFVLLLSTEGEILANPQRVELGALAAPLAAATEPTAATVSLDDTPTRLYLRPLADRRAPAAVLVVGQSLAPEDGALRRLLLVLIGGGVAGFWLALVGAWFLAGRALVPIELALRRQQEFVADASHELRTPLTTIRGNVDLLRRNRDLPSEEVDEALADIASEVQRMSRLVTELLRLARADAGYDLEREPVRLDTVLHAVHRQTQHHKRNTRVELRALDGATVLGSRDALQELFLILVDNALKYTPDGGEVQLAIQRDGAWYTVEVRDNGEGIDAVDLPHIFERFYRSTHVRHQTGTGLGLAIARWIAEQHGGRITVQSTVGRGSVFTVWLPVVPAVTQPASAPEPAALTTAPGAPPA